MLINVIASIVLIFGCIATAAVYKEDAAKQSLSLITAVLTLLSVFGLLLLSYKANPPKQYIKCNIDGCVMYTYKCTTNPFSDDDCSVAEVKSVCNKNVMETFTND